MTWSVKNSRIVKVRSFQAFIKVMTTTVFSNGSKHFMTLPLVGTNDQGLSKISQPNVIKVLEKYKQLFFVLIIFYRFKKNQNRNTHFDIFHNSCECRLENDKAKFKRKSDLIVCSERFFKKAIFVLLNECQLALEFGLESRQPHYLYG